ncbi:MAG: hypothetical protein AAF328_07750 [Planctomycetota bacterium]
MSTLVAQSHKTLSHLTRRRGLTLLELTLALGATGFLGLAIASMLSAVAYGSQTADGLQTLVTRHQVFAGRVGNAIRESRQVLDHSATEVVLWYDDLNDNGVVEGTELMWLRFDGGDRELTMDRADLTVPGIFGAPTEPGGFTNYAFIRWGLDFVNWLEENVWARNLSACEFTLNNADPLLATLVTVTATFEENGQTDTMVHSFKLRN